jgi:hypothetical protein
MTCSFKSFDIYVFIECFLRLMWHFTMGAGFCVHPALQIKSLRKHSLAVLGLAKILEPKDAQPTAYPLNWRYYVDA